MALLDQRGRASGERASIAKIGNVGNIAKIWNIAKIGKIGKVEKFETSKKIQKKTQDWKLDGARAATDVH